MTGKVQGYGTYNEIAQGIFQLAVDQFGMDNKGLDQSRQGFSTGKARFHLLAEDFNEIMDMGARAISWEINKLIDNVEFKKPCLYWVFCNYQMVIAINSQDLK